jgi:FAD/FMN-containing dehydrogenase
MAELAQARTVLEAAGANSLLETDEPSGSQAWANWIQASLPGPAAGDETRSTLLRLGVPPKDAPSIVKDLSSTLDETAFIADMASGLLYVRGFRGVQALSTLRDTAHSAGGYAVLLAGADSLKEAIDPWGYQPDSLALMQRLKARWDPDGLLNPAALVSG